MRGRYTIIHYQMLLKEYSIDTHLCTNRVFVSLKVYFDYNSAFKSETDRVLW